MSLEVRHLSLIHISRYIAHIPNAEQLAIAFRYPSLENAVHETALAVDTAVQKAIKSGDKEYGVNIDEVRCV